MILSARRTEETEESAEFSEPEESEESTSSDFPDSAVDFLNPNPPIRSFPASAESGGGEFPAPRPRGPQA